MSCFDGSDASGNNMTPLFQDHARQQLIFYIMDACDAADCSWISMGRCRMLQCEMYSLV